MARVLPELMALGVIVWLIGWGAIQLYFAWKRERDVFVQTKKEAEEALHDLERAVEKEKNNA